MTDTPLTFEEMERRINLMTPGQRAELEKSVAPMLAKAWLPQMGPQTDAYYSLADETLYGGAAGGGKSDLLLGLATTEHYKSVIFRRQSVDLEGLWTRLGEIAAGRVIKSDATRKRMKLNDGRLIEFGHLEKPGSEKTHQGRDRDLYGFDEAAQMDEFKVAFVIQWLRSIRKGQRTRVVLGTNPPIPEYKDGKLLDTGTGAWLKEWFAPWLEDTYPLPAKPGELRYCFMRTEGDRMRTIWVDGPGCYDLTTGEARPDATEDDINKGLVAVAKSRTFIKSLLKDNIFLKDTGYAARLSSTPEPLKSLLLTGSFTVKGEDHPFQIIPTLWVLAAQERWRKRVAAGEDKRLRQLVFSGDIAQGGADSTVLGELYETDFFGEPLTQAGRETPTGKEVMQLVLTRRKNNALIVLDGTGGWGGSTRDLLSTHHQIECEMFVASRKSTSWVNNGLWKCLNGRAEMWWAFRDALDPSSDYDICLPPSTRLMTQLTAPIFIVKGKTMQVEEKDEVRKRVGSSTDEADMVLQAWMYRDQALAARIQDDIDIVDRIAHGVTPAQRRRERAAPVEFDDPLGDFR